VNIAEDFNMTRMVTTLLLYIFGFIAIAFTGLYNLVEWKLTQDTHVIAVLIGSPVILWSYAAVYQYFFDGACSVCSIAVCFYRRIAETHTITSASKQKARSALEFIRSLEEVNVSGVLLTSSEHDCAS